jgi:two-component system, sensor histidine kinase and response regulator
MLPDILPGIDFASVVRRCGGSETLAREIIIGFRDQNRNVFNELSRALKNGNHDHAKELLHSLKGLAGTIGACSLAATASEMESAVKDECGNLDVLPPAIMEQQLAEVFEAADILDHLLLDQASDTVWVQLPLEELEPLLRKLYDSLYNNSLGAKKIFDQLKCHLRQSERDEIHKQMVRLDFERALAALERAGQSFGINLQRGEHD